MAANNTIIFPFSLNHPLHPALSRVRCGLSGGLVWRVRVSVSVRVPGRRGGRVPTARAGTPRLGGLGSPSESGYTGGETMQRRPGPGVVSTPRHRAALAAHTRAVTHDQRRRPLTKTAARTARDYWAREWRGAARRAPVSLGRVTTRVTRARRARAQLISVSPGVLTRVRHTMAPAQHTPRDPLTTRKETSLTKQGRHRLILKTGGAPSTDTMAAQPPRSQ